ncbi:MAG: hypothetical protein AAFP03_19400, partial [Cyanobacteria bacterium J06598_3]
LLQRPGVAGEIEQHYGAAAMTNTTVPVTQACIAADQLTLRRAALQLQAVLMLKQGHWLHLEQPGWLVAGAYYPSPSLQDFCWDLGPETQIQALTLRPGQLVCAGRVEITP